MNANKLDETNYTTQLASDINSYVKNNSRERPQGAYTPHSTKQSFKNINESSCFDLIYKITNSSLLILEIKVTHDGKKLHSFRSQQRRVDSALREFGIPLDYCYNLKSDYSKVNDEIYTLTHSMVSHPDHVACDLGIIQNQTHHLSLLDKINEFLKSDDGSTGKFGALFSNGLLESMQEVNTKLLFFVYNSENLDVYTLDQIREIYQAYKACIHLAKGIDLENESRDQLLVSFAESAKQLNELLEDRISHKNEDEDEDDEEPEQNNSHEMSP
jgi:hypothetical protein